MQIRREEIDTGTIRDCEHFSVYCYKHTQYMNVLHSTCMESKRDLDTSTGKQMLKCALSLHLVSYVRNQMQKLKCSQPLKKALSANIKTVKNILTQ